MNTQERNEKIELYGRGFDLLKAALAEVPVEAMKWKPEPKEWSVHEIIIHIADSETNSALRARKLIVEPGGTLMVSRRRGNEAKLFLRKYRTVAEMENLLRSAGMIDISTQPWQIEYDLLLESPISSMLKKDLRKQRWFRDQKKGKHIFRPVGIVGCHPDGS